LPVAKDRPLKGFVQLTARRIKRAIFIDVSSIRFQTQGEVNHFARMHITT